MADNKERENLHDPEITSEEYSPIDDDELNLSLGLCPTMHYRRPGTFQKPPEPSDDPFNFHPQNAAICADILSKRGAQALRRLKAKKKRDLKRKAYYNNEEERERCRCCKAAKLNPSWWSWIPAAYGGSVGGGFRPYRRSSGDILAGGKNVEDRDGKNRESVSSGSSSGISDNYQSTSGPGGNESSDAGTHSSHSLWQLPHPPNVQTSQIPPSSSQAKLIKPNSSSPNHSQHQLCSSFVCNNQIKPVTTSSRQLQPSKSLDQGVTTSSDTVPHSSNVVPSSTSYKGPTTTAQSKEPRGETGKPPKPNGQLILSKMPCVSTTGNGPNGKTITGFLYRYTKAEVSIVCVCHGASFSPTGFVEHAGGVGVEHPLRHITVVPFALG